MSGFKFKLEKVLDLKLREEDECKMEHAKALKDKMCVQKELDELNFKYDKYSKIEELEDVVKRKIILDYLSSIHSSIEETTRILEEKQKILEEKQKILIEKQIERKSIEKLKEKQFALYKKEMELKEQNQNDEYALQSYFRLHQNDGEVNSL